MRAAGLGANWANAANEKRSHRWTQMNTDRKPAGETLLRSALSVFIRGYSILAPPARASHVELRAQVNLARFRVVEHGFAGAFVNNLALVNQVGAVHQL